MVRTIGILGAGRVGSAIARTALAAGYQVNIAGSGAAEEIEMLVEVVVPGAHAMSAEGAVAEADLVIVAVPLHKHRTIPQHLLADRLVVDTMNYWPPIDGTLPDFESTASSSEVIRDYFPRARLVKTLNHIGYHDLEIDARPKGHPERRALAVAGDEEDAVRAVMEVLERLGFDAVSTGPLYTGAAFQSGTEIFGGFHTADQIRRSVRHFTTDRWVGADHNA